MRAELKGKAGCSRRLASWQSEISGDRRQNFRPVSFEAGSNCNATKWPVICIIEQGTTKLSNQGHNVENNRKSP